MSILEQYLTFLQENISKQKHFVLQESRYVANDIIRRSVREAEKETQWRKARDKCKEQSGFFKMFKEKNRLSFHLCLIKNEIRFIKRAINIMISNIPDCKRDRPCRTQIEYTVDRSRDAITHLERSQDAIEDRLDKVKKKK